MITLEKEELIHGAQLGPERAIIALALPTMQRRLGERPLILLLNYTATWKGHKIDVSCLVLWSFIS